MDKRQLIRTTHKTLSALVALNQHEALRVAEMARILSLPRTTTTRVLETLRELGYLDRREDDQRYVLTDRVLTLAGGHDSRDQFVKRSKPILDRYCAELRWPLALSTPHGLSLRVRYTTDLKTPYRIFTSSAGIDVPLTQSASGLVYLAFLDRSEREFLLNSLAEQDATAPKLTQLAERLESIRRASYCYVDQSFVRAKQFKGYEMREGVIGVPVMQSGKPIAAIGLRFVKRGRTAASVARVVVAPLHECARELVAAASASVKPA